MTAAIQTNAHLVTAVKALGDGRIGGYLVVWGDADHLDLQGEYFTPKTELGLDWYPRRPALYHHGLDDAIKGRMVGTIDSLKADDTGLWAEAQLTMRERWARAVYELVRKGVLNWSSGTLPHLVEVEPDGKIINWPIVEGSLTPSPAEPRHTNITAKHLSDAAAIKSAFKAIGLPTPDGLTPESATESDTAKEGGGQRDRTASTLSEAIQVKTEGNNPMSEKDTPVQALTAEDIRAVYREERERELAEQEQAELKAKAAERDTLAEENAALKAQLADAEKDQRQPARRLPGRTDDPDLPGQEGDGQKRVIVTVGSPLDNLEPHELAFGVTVMQNLARAKNMDLRPSEQYAKALAHKMSQKGLAVKKADGNYYKADELSYSTQTSYGDEWVRDLWSSELWRKARLDNVILPLFRSIEMPSNPFELPTQGTDPTVYYVPETQDEAQLDLAGSNNPMPDSKIGSGKVTLTAKKLAVRVGFSSELVEDSLVPVLPIYTEQSMRAMADAIDTVLLNGDTVTTASTNINLNNGTPTATTNYLAFDGLRKLPLITNAANAQDASGAPSLALMRTARFLMAGKYSVKPQNLAWIVDAQTYAKLLSLDEVETYEKIGQMATNMTGQLGMIDGIPLLVSGEMGLTAADGKIDSSGNTKGQAVCVYRPGWVVGYRRRINASMTYIPYYDSYQLVATARVAFINFDTDVASALYDITV